LHRFCCRAVCRVSFPAAATPRRRHCPPMGTPESVEYVSTKDSHCTRRKGAR
jgi:hypothetical protein